MHSLNSFILFISRLPSLAIWTSRVRIGVFHLFAPSSLASLSVNTSLIVSSFNVFFILLELDFRPFNSMGTPLFFYCQNDWIGTSCFILRHVNPKPSVAPFLGSISARSQGSPCTGIYLLLLPLSSPQIFCGFYTLAQLQLEGRRMLPNPGYSLAWWFRHPLGEELFWILQGKGWVKYSPWTGFTHHGILFGLQHVPRPCLA